MKPKTLILMVVAIACGLAASYMTSRLIAERNTEKSEEEKVAILVAKQNLATGYLIKEPEKVFEEKLYTKGEEPKRAIRTFDLLTDRRLNKPVNAEGFVTAEDLVSKEQDGLSGIMKPGMRAVGLKVNVDSAVAGFVLPHCRVDIISVMRRNENETYSKIILQNVLVLAVDQTPIRPDDKPAMVPSTVTVQVTPAQAEALSLASDLGSLRLILRSFGDEEKVATRGVTPKSLLQSDSNGEPKEPEPPPKPAPAPVASPPPPAPVVVAKPKEPPPPKTHTLTVFNGEAVTKAVFIIDDHGNAPKSTIEQSQPGGKR
jgi:pilus assembly protein CpaB